MELVTDNVHLIKRFVSDFDAFWVDVGVKFTSDGQSSTGGCGSNEIHNHLMADKRLPSPILTDVCKESMFNLVPLAGSWWQMANGDLQTSFIGQLLQLGLPQPGPVPVAAATVSGDQHTLGVGVGLLPHHVPPAPDARHRKRCSIMIRSHIHPTRVLRRVIHPIWSDLAQLGNLKIMDADSLRLSLRPQLPSLSFEIPYQLLLFRIDRNDRLIGGLKCLDLLVNMLKLGIAVWMRAPLERLPVGLQAIVQLMEQCCYHPVAGLMSHPLQFVGKLAHTLGCPAQWRFRIASGHWFYKTLQVRAKGLIRFTGALASSAGFADAARGILRWVPLPSGQEFFAPGRDGGPGRPGCPSNQRGASVAKRQSLCANIEPKAPLVQQWSQQCIALFEQLSLHTISIP